MSAHTPPTDYWDFPRLEAWARALPAAHAGWVRVEEIGRSRQGRPLLLIVIGAQNGDTEARPALWVDAGTHCAEWAGMMAAVHMTERWLADLAATGAEGEAARVFFAEHTIYVAPCISPDGYQAMHEGAPYLRSTLRPPRAGEPRIGFEPRDIDGDRAVRWMRWRHPAGPFVSDPEVPLNLRLRTLDDDPADAFFVCAEGEFLCPDPAVPAGDAPWIAAPLLNGLDLNRNFPAAWAPFSMFGMDGGEYALSEPESRAMVDAVAARPCIAAALTLHTYTGALLTQPYRKPSPLAEDDVELMDALAQQAVSGTGWRAIRVHPDFMYDPDKPIVGVWADTLSTVFGVPGYTLEIWDPYGHCGQTVAKPAEFFKKPDAAVIRAMVARFSEAPHAVVPWRRFDHPQLGPVEIGGLDYMRTIRNPPLAELPAECGKAFRVAERLRRALPRVQVEARAVPVAPGLTRVEVAFENLGYLPATGLRRGETLVGCPGTSCTLTLSGRAQLVSGAPEQRLTPLDGWGALQVGAHGLYPALSGDRSHRARVSWLVSGEGEATLTFSLARAGTGTRTLAISPTPRIPS
jgi:hypothetical protein